MAKPGEQSPPPDGKPPARTLTPHPEPAVEELDGDDATIEWSISEFTGESVTEPVISRTGGAGSPSDGKVADEPILPILPISPTLPTLPVFHWIEPGADPSDSALITGRPVPGGSETSAPVALRPPRDNGAVAAGALPVDPAVQLHTPTGDSDEIVVLDPDAAAPEPDAPSHPSSRSAGARATAPGGVGPSPPIAGLPHGAGAQPSAPSMGATPPPPPTAAAVAARAPAPPPLPAAGQPAATPLLLPDIPPELIGGGAAPGAWPEALSPRPRKKRLRPWFEEVFDEDYLRTLPFMTAEQTLREVAFVREALAPAADGHLLDIACGYGRHAIELSQRGLRVTGLDLSLPLLIRAADEAQRRSLPVNFVHADMREMAFDSQFDGAYCILSSFGYFDEETNLKVATAICRALKPGGRFLLDTLNRDYIVADLPTRVWWEGDGCVVLEEVDFNFHTSRVIIRRSVVFQDGRQVEQDISIRAYSLHELGKLLRQAGFRVLDVSGSLATKGHFFGATSRNILMVCERPHG